MYGVECNGTMWYSGVGGLSVDWARAFEASGVHHGKVFGAWMWIGNYSFGALHMKAIE